MNSSGIGCGKEFVKYENIERIVILRGCVEKRFGFSKMTFKLWIIDYLKEGILSIILSALLTIVASIFFVKCPSSWWFILAAVLICFTFIMQIIYPKFIAPLFNKFSPLEEGELKEKLSDLLQKTGFVSDGIFIMDASKRSGHSNAYFTGFGKSKRIVLYDTLVEKLSEDELVAVLGHELGHFKLKHILKRLIFVIPLEFLVLFGLYFLAQFVNLYTGFGFSTITAANVSQVQFIGLFLAIMVYGSVSELISPFASFSSRKHEYQADEYAAKITGNPLDLINALIKLNSENLSELIPPKIYVFWNYSHPTIVERTVALKKLIKTKDVAK
jgi:STE24 endopeptidase